jgi:hypothetical protein
MVRDELLRMRLRPEEAAIAEVEITCRSADEVELVRARRESLTEALAAATARLSRLTDLLLDGKIDPSAHDDRRASLLGERQHLEQELASVAAGDINLMEQVRKIIGLVSCPELLYESGDSGKRRQLLGMVMSDCIASGKTLEFSLREPFATIAIRGSEQVCGQLYDTDRTFSVEALISLASTLPVSVTDALQSISLDEIVKTLPA